MSKVCSICGQVEGIEEYDEELWGIYHRLDLRGRQFIEPIVYTADTYPDFGDEDENYEIANLVMEKNMSERGLCGECGRPNLSGIRPEQILSEEDAQEMFDMYAEQAAELRAGC